MSYDLRRPRLHGVVRGLEHSNTDVLTRDGLGVALFYTKVHDGLHSSHRCWPPTARPHHHPCRAALRTVDRSIDDYVRRSRPPESCRMSELITTARVPATKVL